MPPAQTEGETFNLAGMAELATKLQPGLDLNEGPTADAEQRDATAEAAARATIEGDGKPADEKPEGELPEGEEPDADKGEKPEGDEETPEAKTTREAEEAADREAETTAEREAREKVEAEAQSEKEKAEPDSDLEKRAQEIEPHTSKKTRATIKYFQAEAKKARDEARAAAAAREKAESELKAAAEAAKNAGVPKELTEEITRLRSVVQELDANRDPEIVRQFDQPIERNKNAVVEILKQFDYDKNTDGTPNTTAIPNLLKSGLTLASLKPLIEKIEENGFPDEAEAIREAIRDNIRLGRDRAVKVEEIKSVVGERQARRVKAQQEAATSFDRQTIAHAGTVLAGELEALQKEFSYLKKPEQPKPTDTSDMAKAKREQIAEYEKAEQKIGEIAKSFSAEGKAPEDAVKSRGRMAAYAIKAAVLQERLIPRLQRDIKAKDTRIAALEARIAKLTKASDLSRLQGSGTGAGAPKPGAEISKSASTEDALMEFARSQGVSVS